MPCLPLFAARTLLACGSLVLLAACNDDDAPEPFVGPDFQSASPSPAIPVIFSPGVISIGDRMWQWRLTLSPNGKQAFFSRSAQFFPFTRAATIYETRLQSDGTWSTPIVAPFSGTHSDIDPFLSPDNQRLYFSSIRPVNGAARQDIDIWYVERRGDGWGTPVHLGPEVNSTDADELYPSASADGTLYFASGPLFPQAGKHFDIYSAERRGTGFAAKVALPAAINTQPQTGVADLQAAWDFNPEISVDGKTLVFTSLRPGGFGLGDLYVSTKTGTTWSQARNLGPLVNTADDEYHATLSRNGQTLWFVRANLGKQIRGDFYHVRTSALNLK
ncbi:MAG: PD40 domain-containing protein [Gemmatimonadaceae bacterium]|nr:PD40 domain-containing protein [Gemmatimonadaceae bacterium]